MPKCVCGRCSALDPAEGAYSAPPDPLAGFKGPTFGGTGGEGKKRAGNGKKGKGWEKGRGEWKGKGHTGTSFSPLRALSIRQAEARLILGWVTVCGQVHHLRM